MKEKWQKEREGGGSGKDKNKAKAKESATTAEADEDVAWMAHLSDSNPEDDNDDDNDMSTISSDEGSVDWWDELVEEGRMKILMDKPTKRATSPSPNDPNPKPLSQKEQTCHWRNQRSTGSIGQRL